MPKAPPLSLLMLACLLLSAASAGGVEPAPRGYVADRAGIIDAATEQRLTALLVELERKTTARIVVLTVDTTGGQDIHQYAFERADKWKFGANRKGASALVVVAAKDRRYSFQVGYDWEGVLPDGYVGQVGRNYFLPQFRAGRYSQGIFDATALLAGKIAADRNVTLTGMPVIRRPGLRRGPARTLLGLLPLLFFMVVFGLSRRRHRGMLFWGLLAGSMMGGRGGSGGFGGGGFGGFGGGGGGGFGGGGASGGW